MGELGDIFARRRLVFGLAAMIGVALTSAAVAVDEPNAAGDDSAELAKKLQNPISNLISVPFQSNFEWGAGQGSKGFRYLVNVQPVIPISISEDWNVISRTIMPIIHQTDTLGPTTQDGIGDILQSLFLSPKAPGPGGIIWGVGPVFSFPSASNDLLGTEKFGLGPTAVALRQTGGWTYGVLANHVWSVAGNQDRAHVSQTFLQPFLSYTTKTHTTFGINTESTYDWTNTKWTVPVNPFVSQVLKIHGQPISLQVGPKWYAAGPTLSPDWGIRFAVILLFPTK
jgi:hypothetical protein